MPDRVVRRILAPVELSESEEPDLSYAIRLAAQLGAELQLLAVIDTPATVKLIGKHRASTEVEGENFTSTLVAEAKEIVQSVVDQAAQLGVKALGHVIMNEEVEEQILKEALVHKVDLILVRSKGRSTLMKALLGSTAGEILKAAPCPVLVARA
jgi:nucleotide-binding universal stress UspA family protein